MPAENFVCVFQGQKDATGRPPPVVTLSNGTVIHPRMLGIEFRRYQPPPISETAIGHFYCYKEDTEAHTHDMIVQDIVKVSVGHWASITLSCVSGNKEQASLEVTTPRGSSWQCDWFFDPILRTYPTCIEYDPMLVTMSNPEVPLLVTHFIANEDPTTISQEDAETLRQSARYRPTHAA